MGFISVFILALTSCTSPALFAQAISGIKTFRIIPRTDAELELAHHRSRSNGCEHIGPSEPVELTSFTPYLSPLDGTQSGKVPDPSTRRAIFTVGLDMLKEDHAHLPQLSRGTILAYIAAHYVSVQARIQKDKESGQLFLHHRPMVATVSFAGTRLTEEFNETVAGAMDEFRSLGLFVRPRTTLTPESLRTLVLVHKNKLASATPGTRVESIKPVYELVFIRAKVEAKSSDRMTLHSFVTSDQRRTLNYLQPLIQPSRPDECSVRGTIFFTAYDRGNLYPKDSATRKIALRRKSTYTLSGLDEYTRSQGRSGDALDNLSETLDAIIEAKIRNAPQAPLSRN